jgi:hypothetical protein
VADLSGVKVREGATLVWGALARKSVEVLPYPGLHSKVFLFDRHAVVGSMNLSEESQDRLEEAAAAGAVDHIFYADPLTPALKASGLR